jgi:predicted nucleic acid-binding protein
MNSKVCIDASLAIQWLLPTQQNRLAESLLEAWDKDGTELIGPPLFDAELTSVIRLQIYSKNLLVEQGEEAFLSYRELGVKIINHPELPHTAWELAKKYNLPRTYDMQYLAVAEMEDCEVWTLDKKLVNAVRGKNRRVKWAGDYDQH